MKQLFIPALLLALTVTACTNADPKAMAKELCDCVQTNKQASTKAKKIIIRASNSSNFQEALQDELMAIEDETVREEIGEDIQTIAMAFQGNNIKECAAEVDKKHRVSKSDEKEMQVKLVAEMENLDDCTVYAAFIKIGLKEQEKADADANMAASEVETSDKQQQISEE